MTLRSGTRYSTASQDVKTPIAMENINPTVYIYCNHPAAFRTVQDAIQSDPNLQDTVKPYLGCDLSSKRSFSEILVLDTCSVERWQEPLERWHSKGGRGVALVSPETDKEIQQLQILCFGTLGIVAFSENEIKQLPQAIHAAIQGKRWMKRAILDEYINRTRYLLKSFFSPDSQLTTRESEIFELLQQGLSNKQIANALGISERTAKFHVSNLLRKYQLDTRRAFLMDNSRSGKSNSLHLVANYQMHTSNLPHERLSEPKNLISVAGSGAGLPRTNLPNVSKGLQDSGDSTH